MFKQIGELSALIIVMIIITTIMTVAAPRDGLLLITLAIAGFILFAASLSAGLSNVLRDDNPEASVPLPRVEMPKFPVPVAPSLNQAETSKPRFMSKCSYRLLNGLSSQGIVYLLVLFLPQLRLWHLILTFGIAAALLLSLINDANNWLNRKHYAKRNN